MKSRLVPRLILDRHPRLGSFENGKVEIDTSINKEEAARQVIFDPETPSGLFFEAGSGDAELRYLLGVSGNLKIDELLYAEQKARFAAKFEYVGSDLYKDARKNIIAGDLCSETFIEDSGLVPGTFAVVYSNNVFEHLQRPWITAANLYRLLKPGGVGITVVPFSQRYHEAPGDYFRYTHTGIASLFEAEGPLLTIRSGYDILGRRNNWQGGGTAKDIVPLDEFGAWRETWFTFHAFRKGETAICENCGKPHVGRYCPDCRPLMRGMPSKLEHQPNRLLSKSPR